MPERWPALMKAKDAAEYLGVSTEELRCMRDRGQVTPVRTRSGALPKYRRSDLDEWIESLELEPTRRPAAAG